MTAPTPGTPATTWQWRGDEVDAAWAADDADDVLDALAPLMAARVEAAREEGRDERLAWPGGPTVAKHVAEFDVLLGENAEATKAIREMGAEIERLRARLFDLDGVREAYDRRGQAMEHLRAEADRFDFGGPARGRRG